MSYELHYNRIASTQVMVSHRAVFGSSKQSPLKAVLDTTNTGSVRCKRTHFYQFVEVNHAQLTP